jgi:hypothetical protein
MTKMPLDADVPFEAPEPPTSVPPIQRTHMRCPGPGCGHPAAIHETLMGPCHHGESAGDRCKCPGFGGTPPAEVVSRLREPSPGPRVAPMSPGAQPARGATGPTREIEKEQAAIRQRLESAQVAAAPDAFTAAETARGSRSALADKVDRSLADPKAFLEELSAMTEKRDAELDAAAAASPDVVVRCEQAVADGEAAGLDFGEVGALFDDLLAEVKRLRATAADARPGRNRTIRDAIAAAHGALLAPGTINRHVVARLLSAATTMATEREQASADAFARGRDFERLNGPKEAPPMQAVGDRLRSGIIGGHLGAEEHVESALKQMRRRPLATPGLPAPPLTETDEDNIASCLAEALVYLGEARACRDALRELDLEMPARPSRG